MKGETYISHKGTQFDIDSHSKSNIPYSTAFVTNENIDIGYMLWEDCLL